MAKQTQGQVPRFRFAGFSSDWEERPIGEILSETKRPIVLLDDQEYELITVKRRNGGVVSRGHLRGRDILVKNYSQLKGGDFVISKRQVVHGATGIVPQELDEAIVSNEYLVADSNEEMSTEFLTLLSSLPEMRQKFFLSSYGVDIEKMFFDADDWKKRNVTLPKLAEQSRVCSFFKELDQMIGLHQRKHKKLLTLKQAMLQKMFPLNGKSSPEIRFKGFSKAWREFKLGDLGNPYSGLSGKTKDDFGHGAGRYVTYMSVFSNAVSDESMTDSIEVDTTQTCVKYGDVFFTTSSESPEEVGMSSVWIGDSESTYLNSFCFGLRPTAQIDTYFLAFLLRSADFRERIAFLAQGISRYNISKLKTMKLVVMLPDNLEQQKIGSYFRNLDELTSKHATQLKKLKQIKSACLEKMFV
jgi:type I restriction enzyme S subunit